MSSFLFDNLRANIRSETAAAGRAAKITPTEMTVLWMVRSMGNMYTMVVVSVILRAEIRRRI